MTDEPGVAAADRRGFVSRFALDLTPIRRYPAFRRLWFGQGVSFIGTEIEVRVDVDDSHRRLRLRGHDSLKSTPGCFMSAAEDEWPMLGADGFGQFQQAQKIGDRRARAADRVGRLLLAQLEFVDQPS